MKIYRIDARTTVQIGDEVLKKINKYRQYPNMKEAGGILLGKIKSDYSVYEITDVSEPSKFDKRSRFGFIRSKKSAQIKINQTFKESDGIVQYMGEWHTHPEIEPYPSKIDKQLMGNCAKNTKNISHNLFMIILGYDGSLYIGYIKNKSMDLINISEKKVL